MYEFFFMSGLIRSAPVGRPYPVFIQNLHLFSDECILMQSSARLSLVGLQVLTPACHTWAESLKFLFMWPQVLGNTLDLGPLRLQIFFFFWKTWKK